MTLVGIALVAFSLGWLTADYLRATARAHKSGSTKPW